MKIIASLIVALRDARVSKLRPVWSGGRPNRWSTVVADLDTRLAP